MLELQEHRAKSMPNLETMSTGKVVLDRSVLANMCPAVSMLSTVPRIQMPSQVRGIAVSFIILMTASWRASNSLSDAALR